MQLSVNRIEQSGNGSRWLNQPAPSRRRQTALALRRRHARLMREFASDLGLDRPTVAECGLLATAATLALRAEQVQAAVVRGELIDGDELIRLSGEARRILTALRKRAPEQQRHVPLRERLAAEAEEEAA
jgi:hypothetical protein